MTLLLQLLPLLPVGLLAGLLSGLLGIGGGLIFAPLLLLLGLPPHGALATSTVAIVPTTVGGTLAHLRQGTLPWRGGLVMAATAAASGVLFSQLGGRLQGSGLLVLQALMYAGLTLSISPRSQLPQAEGASTPPAAGLVAVGAIAGAASGLVGVGGGLVIVPVLVRCLQVPVHQAVRYSTLAVLASASTASLVFLADGRAQGLAALVLGSSAAITARWSAARLDRVPEAWLVQLLRLLTAVLACTSGAKAILAWRGGG